VHYHHNEGLRPYQKVVGQVGIAIIVAVFLYLSGRTSLTFFAWQFDIGFLVVPLAILVLVATANSVNLTDGLDGLAGGVSFVYLLFFGIILALVGSFELQNLALLCFGLCGGILGFLLQNCFPAKIFMGDTGSLALGGFIGVVAVLSGLELLLPIMGIMFVLSALSDIIQVLHFKRTKKRVFLMAPLHHHFEQKGVHENRIVVVYIVITTAVCLAVLAGVLSVGI
jgi:phospho-N-acetylmuramoyl-pentapeptide-transferase